MIDKNVFQSVIQITRHRDLDSLDVGFVRVLEGLFPVTSVTLFRLPKEEQIDSLEEILFLDTSSSNSEVVHSWSSEARVLDVDDHLQQCMQQAEPICHTTPRGQRLLVPIMGNKRIRGVIALESTTPLEQQLETIQGVIEIYGNYMTVLHESERDNLTGLLSRRIFDNKLGGLLDSQRHSKDPCKYSQIHLERRAADDLAHSWLAVLDIDHFKRINDTYGHVYGDEILLRLAHKMRECFRKVDLLFRVGGEEFVIVLAPESKENAQRVLDRFREMVAAQGVPGFDAITVSIGFAKLSEGDFPRDIYDQADKALYFAKENGRNQVRCHDDLVAEGLLSEEDASGSIELF
jgi:diguanylate cyclase (GGDEF)-like protein